jgi:hypothetical protein
LRNSNRIGLIFRLHAFLLVGGFAGDLPGIGLCAQRNKTIDINLLTMPDYFKTKKIICIKKVTPFR